MKQRVIRRREGAQALVEFALAATLIFFLLAAVVDLGLIYFTQQALRVAAQEGATFGSYPVQIYRDEDGNFVSSPSSLDGLTFDRVDLNYPEIVYRVYGSGGDQGGGFANLRDLDNCCGEDPAGRDDLAQGLHNNMATDPEAYIYVENLAGADPRDLIPSCETDVPGRGLQRGGEDCWIRVTVRYEYQMLFPFAPAFADTVRLQASHLMPIRSSFYTSQ